MLGISNHALENSLYLCYSKEPVICLLFGHDFILVRFFFSNQSIIRRSSGLIKFSCGLDYRDSLTFGTHHFPRAHRFKTTSRSALSRFKEFKDHFFFVHSSRDHSNKISRRISKGYGISYDRLGGEGSLCLSRRYPLSTTFSRSLAAAIITSGRQ